MAGETLRAGGMHLDDSIASYVRKKYGIIIGQATAELVKITIGAALPMEEEMSMEIQGQDQVTGLPRPVTLTTGEVVDALEESLDAVVETARRTLEKTPPELVSDIIDRGVAICGGGALLREKIVAQSSRYEIIIVDESKLSPALGTHWAVPVEVIPFGWRTQYAYLESLGARPVLRLGPDGSPFITDQGNYILDSAFGPIADPVALERRLDSRTGIVCHGLFLGIANEVIVAGASGIQYLKR